MYNIPLPYQDRISTSSRDGDHDQSVSIEVYADGVLGQEAVLVASLSNSVLLVIRIGGEGQVGGAGGGLRSWLLEWPVAGKVWVGILLIGGGCGVKCMGWDT